MRGMFLARLKSVWLPAAAIALLIVLAAAAVLQYRLINRASEADMRQQREYTERSLRGFSGDFQETVLGLLPFFRPSPGVNPGTDFEQRLTGLTAQWLSTSTRPQMLGHVSFGVETSEGFVFKRMRVGEGRFAEAPWPEELALYRDILEKRLRMPGGEPPLFPNGFAFELSAGRPVLVFPLVTNPSPVRARQGNVEPPPPPLPRSAEGPPPRQPPTGPRGLLDALRPAPTERVVQLPELNGWCFLELDTDYLRGQLLPALVERHFGLGPGSDYVSAVVTGRAPRILYQSEAGIPGGDLSRVDAGIVIFEPRMQQARQPPPPPPPPPPQPEGGPDDAPMERRPGRPPQPSGPQPFFREGDGAFGRPPVQLEEGERIGEDAWRLILKSKAGSLESLVAQSRRRNLALSFGILLLLAGSTVMLMIATTRARRLSRQQMEFVAGVSHELRTPLAVIQSTSYNLSKGMIHDPARVEKYGAVIQKEARRLINQVEQMLSFAGIQSGRKPYELRPVSVASIVNRSLAEYAAAFEESGWRVEKDVDEGLPQVMADAQSLESAFKNLVENALKYAAKGKWLGVSARSAEKGTEVQVTVADRGPGIDAADLPHIFEPFYRGSAVQSSTTAGAGLGLSLVERHMRAQKGRVTVKSSAEGGTAFTLHLQVATDTEGEHG